MGMLVAPRTLDDALEPGSDRKCTAWLTLDTFPHAAPSKASHTHISQATHQGKSIVKAMPDHRLFQSHGAPGARKTKSIPMGARSPLGGMPTELAQYRRCHGHQRSPEHAERPHPNHPVRNSPIMAELRPRLPHVSAKQQQGGSGSKNEQEIAGDSGAPSCTSDEPRFRD